MTANNTLVMCMRFNLFRRELIQGHCQTVEGVCSAVANLT